MVARTWRTRHKPRWHVVLAAFVSLAGLGLLLASPMLIVQAIHAVRAHQLSAENAGSYDAGELVHDGPIDFTVTSTRCGASTVGSDITAANGQFCVVRVTVRNVGVDPVTLTARAQRAIGSRGASYFPDPPADTAVTGEMPFVAPGESVHTAFVYDIPIGIKLTDIELHASEYSQGVQVHL